MPRGQLATVLARGTRQPRDAPRSALRSAPGMSVATGRCMRQLLAVGVFGVLGMLASCAETPSRGPDTTPPPEDPPADGPLPQDPPPPPDPMAVLATFQSCMTLADFQAANMPGTWGNMTTTTNTTKCVTCHVNGGNGFIASTNAQAFFNVLQTDKYYLLEFVTVAPSSEGGYQVVADDHQIPSVGTGQAPHAEHPRFMATAGMAAVHAFVDATLSHCSAPI
jgi:hypothetical protein